MSHQSDESGTYRDAIATISKEGKRNFIHPKKPKGRYYDRRTAFSIIYLILFFTVPFIYVNDEPLMMFNVLERKFILFGMVFWPQDFFIFGIGMLTFIVFIALFTVVFGRVFCGWACPQTIFMEMVFRKIEYLIDGDASQQKLLETMPWNSKKIIKRSLKFILFFLLSFIIANFFLAYLIGIRTLLDYIIHPRLHTSTLVSLFVFTSVFFFVYWWFREQACIVVCPYGRLQGVLLDKNTIIVAYDHKRGEPRGHEHKSKTELTTMTPHAVFGDCVDCSACVRVCPTGIDIRNGTQLECVNCTACMDACDDIMTAVHKPAGLIRYASENSISQGKKLTLNLRIKAYSTVLLLLVSLLAFLIISRSDLDVRLMRTAGMTYTTLPDGKICNLFNLKLTNKTHKNIHYALKLENVKGEIEIIGENRMMIPKEAYDHCQFFVILDRNEIKNWKTQLQLGVYEEGEKVKEIEAKFIGPEQYN